MSEDFTILETKDNEDGSMTVVMELSEQLRDLLISKGFNAILKEGLTYLENESETE